MGQTFDFAKARQAIRMTRRRMQSIQDRLSASREPISFAAAQARRRLRDAEVAVKRLQILLDEGRSGRIDFTLVAEIVVAERRLNEVREALRHVDRTGLE